MKRRSLFQIRGLFSLLPHWQMVQNTKLTNNSISLEKQKTSISLLTLQNTKSQGGLETPSFLHYFLPNQLQNVFNIKENRNNPWLDSAQINVKPPHLQTFTSYNNQSRNRTTSRISLSPQLWQFGGKHIKSPSHITQ